MPLDPKNALTFSSLFPAKSQATNNTASTGLDMKAYEGALAVRVAVGVQTAGDNGGTFKVQLQAAANNTASEATNIVAIGSDATSYVTTGNNLLTYGSTLHVDPRANYRYLFGRITITGGNSPAAPLAVEVCGQKQVQ
jgi:hypothetical protein